MKVTVDGTHDPHPSSPLQDSASPSQDRGAEPETTGPLPQQADPHVPGPRPIGTLMVIAILLLVTTAFWMMVLGVQQGRA